MAPARRLALAALAAASLALPPDDTPLSRALRAAEASLQSQRYAEARALLDRALERDAKHPGAWDLRARWAEAVGDRDELVFALHVRFRLLHAQKAARAELDAVRKRIEDLDPFAADFLKLRQGAIDRLVAAAERYEKDQRPHAAIRTHRLILALDPERAESERAIERISAAPDPSLAETAKAKDLLAGISEDWIREHDLAHATWETRATAERENYVTHTDAGYAVLARSAEAMEQMNGFYRQFFRYGTSEDKHKVPRIEVHIFRSREEYLKLGQGPPVEWSGGQFTGGAVETYVDGGFEGMVTTLFHEAAHQFVSLATSAAGWLNEGLASYFEGSRILANGTVIMNLPANHRLFPLADRMQRGWMASAKDGLDPANASKEPETAPTFRIVLENEYAWGPPWYAPTWGVVFFLWNYQDPVDGRFLYRNAFRTYVNASGGKTGKTAIETFEKVVLGNPEPPTPKVDPKLWKKVPAQPKTVDELSEVWKEWMLALRDEQAGKLVTAKPYLAWARYALARKDLDAAVEQFEKGLLATPDDPEIRIEFGRLLAKELKNPDRAAKIVLGALRAAEAKDPPDKALAGRCEQLLQQWDPGHVSLEQLQRSLGAAGRNLSRRYLAAGLPMMAMDLSFRLASELGLHDLFEDYEAAYRSCRKSLAIWKLAYNEKNLDGWIAAGNTTYTPAGEELLARQGAYAEDQFTFQFLTLDTVTSGDFSMEAEITAEPGKVNFCGLVFGRKSDTTFHAFLYFPPRGTGVETGTGYVDLTSFYGGGAPRIWRHDPVRAGARAAGTGASSWHRLRVDVTGPSVDVWFDGDFVTTQEFPSLDVLRGSFGLLMGPGEARFRNARYLARPARDRAAQIERALRLAERPPEQGQNGSWLGAVPPFPKIVRWVRGARADWREKGAVPQLLVFWSARQNDLIPLHEWLQALSQKYADAGLEIVAVCSQESASTAAQYVEAHPFPGAVGIDSSGHHALGDTFRDFGIDRLGVPRLVLLDVDQRVVWEGDPGFRSGKKWSPGEDTYLDTPLEELVSRRKLREAAAWRRAWSEKGLTALRSGDFAAAAPLLKAAVSLAASGDPAVADAAAKVTAIEGALGSLDQVARACAEWRCEPAVAALVAWGSALDLPLDPKWKGTVAAAAASPNGRGWSFAVEVAKAHRGKLAPGKEKGVAESAVERLGQAAGALPEALARELASAAGYDDVPAITKLLAEADRLPGQWLASRYFRW